jgi:hypothetical protein
VKFNVIGNNRKSIVCRMSNNMDDDDEKKQLQIRSIENRLIDLKIADNLKHELKSCTHHKNNRNNKLKKELNGCELTWIQGYKQNQQNA